MSDTELRRDLQRLAHANPDGIRRHLVSMLREAADWIAPGKWYKQEFRDGDTWWFHGIAPLKNGNVKGLQVVWYDGDRNPRKAVFTSLNPKFDRTLWTEIRESDVDSKAMAKFKARL
jgi:hypothetical protein